MEIILLTRENTCLHCNYEISSSCSYNNSFCELEYSKFYLYSVIPFQKINNYSGLYNEQIFCVLRNRWPKFRSSY